MEMTYAQALTEAKQVILQQAARIKADAEKLKIQQQMILEQGGAINEKDSRIKDQDIRIEQQSAELRDLGLKLDESTTAREQADAIINRQGERVNGLQNTVTELEQRSEDLGRQVAELAQQRDDLAARLPSQDDAEALAAMASLLSRKVSGNAARPMQPMRLAEAA